MRYTHYKHLSYTERTNIEVLLRAGHTPREIAQTLGRHISTIYREIKKGTYIHRNSDWTEEKRYSPEMVQDRYDESLRARGPQLKIGNDMKLANFLEYKIGREKYSPEAALACAKMGHISETHICVTTLYSYIDKGIFLTITNKSLPVKRDKKRDYKKVKRQKRPVKGESIERRPEEILLRNTVGHWEMDTVVGSRGDSHKTMLVLTERRTRNEILELMPDRTAKSVVRALNRIERHYGEKLFRKLFRTITVDNGTEFSNCKGMECSRRGKEPRTKIYYCHAYSSWERGSNENQNRLVRRHIPKGTNFDHYTSKQIKYIQKWINDYPRRIFQYRSSAELFKEALQTLVG